MIPRLLPLMAAALLGACQSTIPVVREAIRCPVPAELLAKACAAPTPLAAGSTYADVLAAAVADRAALTECAAHDRLLARAVTECNAAIDQHNAALREINAGTVRP